MASPGGGGAAAAEYKPMSGGYSNDALTVSDEEGGTGPLMPGSNDNYVPERTVTTSRMSGSSAADNQAASSLISLMSGSSGTKAKQDSAETTSAATPSQPTNKISEIREVPEDDGLQPPLPPADDEVRGRKSSLR